MYLTCFQKSTLRFMLVLSFQILDNKLDLTHVLKYFALPSGLIRVKWAHYLLFTNWLLYKRAIARRLAEIGMLAQFCTK